MECALQTENLATSFFDRVKEAVKTKIGKGKLQAFFSELQIDYEKYKSQKRYNILPRADEAIKIATALKTSVEYLVTGIENKVLGLSQEEQTLIENYRKLKRENQITVLDFVNTLALLSKINNQKYEKIFSLIKK